MKDKKTQTNDNLTTTVEQTVTLDPTVVPIDKLVLAPKMQAFIRQHRNDDVRTLALRAPRDAEFDLTLALEQIAGWQTAQRKLPTWAKNDAIVYPPHLSMEQCSSEQTARYKAELAKRLTLETTDDVEVKETEILKDAENLKDIEGLKYIDVLSHSEFSTDVSSTLAVDLTGGFGVDFSFIAPLFDRAIYCERNPQLCTIARHNFRVLGLDNACVANSEAERLLQDMPPANLIFIDPARRDGNGGKTVAIADCTPDVSALRPLLVSKGRKVMIKLSPMLDWHKAVADMCGSVAEVHIVATGGECKELLLVADSDSHDSVSVTCVNDTERFSFTHTEGEQQPLPPLQDTGELFAASPATATSQHAEAPASLYLYEPNASIMKAGCFGLLAVRYGLRALGRNSNLFVSNAMVNGFPGRQFAVTGCSTMNRQSLKALLADINSANVAVRNMPLSADALRKKLALKDGGDSYVFGTTAADGTHVILLCKRI